MSQIINKGDFNSPALEGSNETFALNNDRNKRHKSVLYGLDQDYDRQLKHLKRITREARLSFTEFNKPPTIGHKRTN